MVGAKEMLLTMKSFEERELDALYYVTEKMVLADGKVIPEEVATVKTAMSKVGIETEGQLQQLKKNIELMSEEECFGLIAFLDPEQKIFVSSLLGAISSSDGDIDDNELELWRYICDKCDLPVMNNRQAINIFNSF